MAGSGKPGMASGCTEFLGRPKGKSRVSDLLVSAQCPLHVLGDFCGVWYEARCGVD